MNEYIFKNLLYEWSERNPRELPWFDTRDPYKIWISEIMLQQTRVAQGIPYYNKFIKRFPNIKSLSESKLDEVLKYWEGLGYYSRARNLHISAKYIINAYNGKFPNKYEQIISLKGIGPYTAAAISSFAFNGTYAVVDGNVIRFISRVFGIDVNPISQLGKKTFHQITTELIDKKNPGKFNQAMMDFGSFCCKPKNPNCSECTFSDHCLAYQTQTINAYPFKKTKLPLVNRYFHFYFISDAHHSFYISKRARNDIWADLYEMPLIESKSERAPGINKVIQLISKMGISKRSIKIEKIGRSEQKLSHQHIKSVFYSIRTKTDSNKINLPYKLVNKENFRNFAFPKTILVFLDQFIRT